MSKGDSSGFASPCSPCYNEFPLRLPPPSQPQPQPQPQPQSHYSDPRAPPPGARAPGDSVDGSFASYRYSTASSASASASASALAPNGPLRDPVHLNPGHSPGHNLNYNHHHHHHTTTPVKHLPLPPLPRLPHPTYAENHHIPHAPRIPHSRLDHPGSHQPAAPPTHPVSSARPSPARIPVPPLASHLPTTVTANASPSTSTSAAPPSPPASRHKQSLSLDSTTSPLASIASGHHPQLQPATAPPVAPVGRNLHVPPAPLASTQMLHAQPAGDASHGVAAHTLYGNAGAYAEPRSLSPTSLKSAQSAQSAPGASPTGGAFVANNSNMTSSGFHAPPLKVTIPASGPAAGPARVPDAVSPGAHGPSPSTAAAASGRGLSGVSAVSPVVPKDMSSINSAISSSTSSSSKSPLSLSPGSQTQTAGAPHAPLSSGFSPIPQLQPSTGSTLGSLPILSPISPLSANSFAAYTLRDTDDDDDDDDNNTTIRDDDNTTALHDGIAKSPSFTAVNPRPISWVFSASGSGSAEGDFRSGSTASPGAGAGAGRHAAARVLSLHNSPAIVDPNNLSLSPTNKAKSSLDLDSPRLRDSPSVARKRTIVEGSDVSLRASPVEVACSSTTHEPSLPGLKTPPPRSTQASDVFEYDIVPSSPSPKRGLDPASSAAAAAAFAPARSSHSSCRDIEPPRKVSTVTPSQAPPPSSNTSMSIPMPLPMPIPTPAARQASSSSTSVPTPQQQQQQPTSPPRSAARVTSGASGVSKESFNNTLFPVPIPSPGPPSAPAPTSAAASTLSPAAARTPTSPSPAPSQPLPNPIAAAATLSPTTATRAAPPSPRPPPSPRSRSVSQERSRSFTAPSPRIEHPPPNKSATAPSPIPMSFTPRHQPTNSASNFPAIAGLADAGPYPTAPPPQYSVPPINGPSGSLAIPNGGPGGGGAPRNIPAAFRQQEEVCLECMMRDRDLASVIVQGEGVWDRESDAGWRDLQEREHELMRAWSADHSTMSGSVEEDSSKESEAQSSPRSLTSGLPDEGQRAQALRKQRREARRAQREEQDAQIARVGWRGFKWEEGTDGDGFPRGFRGTRPGALTEMGIKNVLTIFPSSSALRYQILQNYLRGQYRLILEVRQEAQRLGSYPEPEEPSYPESPTISNEGGGPGPSGSRPRRLAPRSMDLSAPSIKAPSISTARSAPVAALPAVPTLRQSPSTPAGLGSQVTHRSRPRTYYSDREPMPNHAAANAAASGSAARTSHYKVPSGSTMPKGRDSRFYSDDWSDAEDIWPPASPASGNLRPFSFAVRAAGGQGSEASHSRRSFFGRFGGSVTSLFTGSHGGSGSMMDMHLGLEADRRNRTSSYQVHDNPRVGLSPSTSRPPFNSRMSHASSVYLAGQDEQYAQQPLQPQPRERERDRPRSRSVSGSRLTQVSLFDDVDDPPQKKKGLKGLLQKMKPRGKRQGSTSSLVGININGPPHAEEVSTTELAPPPPMAFLVGRKDREHNRQGSGSSQSNDDASSISLSPQAVMTPSGSRSVSAPMATGSPGSSPTSSRFQNDRRDDATGRRRTEPALELPPGAGEPPFNPRGPAVMEMLTGSSQASVPNAVLTPVTPVYDEPQSFGMVPNGQHIANQAPAGYRKSKQPSLSSRYSTSTTTVPAIETPDPAASAAYLVPHQTPASPGTPAANRHKNLPPLPPGGPVQPDELDLSFSSRASMYEQQKRMSTYTTGSAYPRASMVVTDGPTIHRAALPPSADYFPTASPRYTHAPPMPGNGTSSPTPYMQPVPNQGRTLQPRASFDVLSVGGDSRRGRRGSTAVSSMLVPDDMRHPPSIYMNHQAAASTGSFGRFLKGNDVAKKTVINSVPHTEDKKERRRGIMSIFSKRG